MLTRRIAFISEKGGSAKTTLVSTIDMNPQGQPGQDGETP
jgi:hypothetical protein